MLVIKEKINLGQFSQIKKMTKLTKTAFCLELDSLTTHLYG